MSEKTLQDCFCGNPPKLHQWDERFAYVCDQCFYNRAEIFSDSEPEAHDQWNAWVWVESPVL